MSSPITGIPCASQAADSALSTALSTRPARFWQLEIDVAGSKEFFFLPIY